MSDTAKRLPEPTPGAKPPHMGILPDPEKRVRSTLTLNEAMWAKLDEVAKNSKDTHPPNGLSRNDVIEHFIKWALEQYDREQAEKEKAKARARK